MDPLPLELASIIAEYHVPLLFCKKGWSGYMKKNRVDWRYQHAANIGYEVEFNTNWPEVFDPSVKMSLKWTKNGLVHSIDDMPAIVINYGRFKPSMIWAKDNYFYRDHGPAEISYYSVRITVGDKSCVAISGREERWRDGKNTGGDIRPSVVCYSGGKVKWKLWTRGTVVHRVDGPACESAQGQDEWWINGERVPLGRPRHGPLLTERHRKRLLKRCDTR